MDRDLTSEEFNEHTNRIISAATADGILPNDVICCTAKALGVLIAFTARRERKDRGKLLKFCQKAVGDFANEAEQFMTQNPQGNPPPMPSRKWSLAHAFLYAFLLMLATFALQNFNDSGADLTNWMRNGKPHEFIAYLFGWLLALPIIVVFIAFIRNRFV